jgi:hypothetical protein
MYFIDFSFVLGLTIVYRFGFKRIDDLPILGTATDHVTEAAPSFASVSEY